MLRLGIAQTDNHYDLQLNLKSIQNAIEVHALNQVDLVLFPECATTGYNRGLLTIDEKALLESIETIRGLARHHRITLALPTPWPKGDGKFYNSVLIINQDGEVSHRIDKVGFQKGEERLFTPGEENQKRTFTVNGHQIGVLICFETTHEPWSFVKSEDQCQLILWPGFYATKPGQDWDASDSPDALKIRENMKSWQCPLIQVTCASSPEAQHWPDKVFGGSVVVNQLGKAIHVAQLGAEDQVAITFNGKEILETQSLK